MLGGREGRIGKEGERGREKKGGREREGGKKGRGREEGGREGGREVGGGTEEKGRRGRGVERDRERNRDTDRGRDLTMRRNPPLCPERRNPFPTLMNWRWRVPETPLWGSQILPPPVALWGHLLGKPVDSPTAVHLVTSSKQS